MQQQASWWSDRTHRTLVAVVAAVVLVVAVVLWLALRGGGGGDNGSAKPASSSASSSDSAASGTTINGRSASPSAESSKASTSTAAPPPAPKPLKHPPKPVQATFGKAVRTGGVTASIVRVESVKGQAHGIGEVAGPALRFTVKVTNQGAKPVSLNLALINVYYGTSKTPASSLSGPGYSPLPQKLKAAGSATGRYVFGIPSGNRQTLRVEFSYKADAPTVIFRGSA